MDDLILNYQIRYRRDGVWHMSDFKMTEATAKGHFEWEDSWPIVSEPVEGEHLYLLVDKSLSVTPKEWKSRELIALYPTIS